MVVFQTYDEARAEAIRVTQVTGKIHTVRRDPAGEVKGEGWIVVLVGPAQIKRAPIL